MELSYPINLIGLADGLSSGDVLTRDGEYLGTWKLDRDEQTDRGALHFIEDGTTEPLFSEPIPALDIGMAFGRAMSDLCAAIRGWHDAR